MFGYIKPYEDEMKLSEYRLYRSLYCGLCNVSKRIGFFSRFFLSYDYTFFAAVRMIFTGEEFTLCQKRCGFHLFAKKEVAAENEALRLSSGIFSILTYYKLLDTVSDEGFWKRLSARLILPYAGRMRRRAIKLGFREADIIISDCMEKISSLEKRSADINSLADTFGEMLGHLLKSGLSEDSAEEAYTVGYEVGRFIYFADALDDIYEDSRNRRFNPLLAEFSDAESALAAFQKDKNSLYHGTDHACDLLVQGKGKMSVSSLRLLSIIENILYLGCPGVIEGIFRKKEKNKQNEKSI